MIDYGKIRYALIYTNEIKYDDIAWEFAYRQYDAEIFDSGVSVYSNDPEDANRLKEMLQENRIDVAISMDFCPALSMACQSIGVKYVAWIYDEPQEGLYDPQICNGCNYIFSFDKNQCIRVKDHGCQNVYHLPLATNVHRNLGLIITSDDEERFNCDVSFVGSLYDDPFYNFVFSSVNDSTLEEIKRALNIVYGKWDGIDRLKKNISSDALEDFWQVVKPKLPQDYVVDREDYFESRFLSRYITYRERTAILNTLSGYDTRLFTGDMGIDIDGIKSEGRLSYDEELPKLYSLSKINLNISLHCITSGIPLRVFDIMGVGGFMLTNYQPEIEELFEIGKNIEAYHDIAELQDKVKFYLEHDEARKRIAINGYELVKKEHNYANRLDEILSTIYDGEV